MSFVKNISTIAGNDAELVQQYQQSGDLSILGALYSRYMDLLYGVCLKYLEDPQLAKDAVMQVFESLVEKLKKHKVDNFRGWVYTVAKNHCLMQLRSGKNKKTIALEESVMQNDAEWHLNGELQKEEEFRKLEYCLQTLQTEQKKAVELFYLQNRCYHDIAAATGLEWNKIRSLIQNGRRNLKICMEKERD